MKCVDVLVIDEISMMENHAFERLNEVMKEARGDTRAFGGVATSCYRGFLSGNI